MSTPGAGHAGWLETCRRIAARGRRALEQLPGTAQRAVRLGRGEGGDMTLAIDQAVEDVVFAEIGALGEGLCVVSEERGEVTIAGGGELWVVIDPIDGSLNAKRGLPPYSLSIAVARGRTMGDVEFAYVYDFTGGEEWWAERGGGAFQGEQRLELGDARLEILGLESAQPSLIAAAASSIGQMSAHRVRMIGSIAISLCYVASARFDAMLSLRESRSVDAAAGQLIVREAGGAVAFPDAGDLSASLDLDMRSRVLAAASDELLSDLAAQAPAGLDRRGRG